MRNLESYNRKAVANREAFEARGGEAAATPANSDSVVPKFATMVVSIAKAVTLRLKRSRMRAASDCRRALDSPLESARPSGTRRESRMTAAAVTGPASGPRPASSTPATLERPRLQNRSS